MRLWGLPVLPTTRETENTGLVGGFRQGAEIRLRRGVTIKVSDSHGENFSKGIVVLRADVRLALVPFRETAFCTVTSI